MYSGKSCELDTDKLEKVANTELKDIITGYSNIFVSSFICEYVHINKTVHKKGTVFTDFMLTFALCQQSVF